MNLCIDQGNTRTKIALFEKESLIESFAIDPTDYGAWKKLFYEHTITNIIISSVKSIEKELINLLKSNSATFIELNHLTPLPIKNQYQTPESLGKDRLAAAIGAYSLQPDKDILIIDAGTAITFDFLSSNGEYKGGNIAPGLEMRFKALHTFTKKLPLISEEGETPLIGLNSEQAIRAGVVNGMIYEIEGYIRDLKTQYPEVLIFLTGGNCFFFECKLKSSIFANHNLVLIGLNRIVNYNA